MELKIFKRNAEKKSEINKIRRSGDIPAVIYSKGEKNENIYVSGADFGAVLRILEEGHLATTVFILVLDKEKIKVIIKEIQYNPVTYNVDHIDFLRIGKDPVSVNVPVVCLNINDCAGVKLGGILRRVFRSIRVKCLPKDIPSHFEIDIKDMQIAENKTLKDLNLPAKVTPVDLKMDDVVIAVGRPAKA